MFDNLLLMTDSYKVTHWKQYPPGTSHVYSYFESRLPGSQTVFFGLSYFLQRYLAERVVTEDKINEAYEFWAAHLGSKDLFNEAGWRHILNDHAGRLPIQIRAVPEGTPLPTQNALMTVVNTCDKCFWVTNYLETLLSQVWYPTTIASNSHALYNLILDYLEQTGNPELISFKLHDFGYRGSTSPESAALGAAAHLLSFQGTDTAAGLELIRDYYALSMAGFSIPAAEHSTITSWGKGRELEAYKNMLTQFPTGPVAVVSDSYNIFDACRTLWGEKLKEQVLKRDGFVVIRPDSGNPIEVVLKVLEILDASFGSVRNPKGYRVLDPHVRIIQGDGIDAEMIHRILAEMKADGWSADNIAFGSGGGLLQNFNRDTYKFAFKCSAAKINGVWQQVKKDPITDPGKNSKGGLLETYYDKLNREYRTFCRSLADSATHRPVLTDTFLNGTILTYPSFTTLRVRSRKPTT